MNSRRFNRRQSSSKKGYIKWILLVLIIILWVSSYIYISGDFSEFKVINL